MALAPFRRRNSGRPGSRTSGSSPKRDRPGPRARAGERRHELRGLSASHRRARAAAALSATTRSGWGEVEERVRIAGEGMKVAFIGTHGVGKTTLCFELAALLKKRDKLVEMVREVARFCPLPINRDTTIAAQSWILHTEIAEELAAENKAEIVICDRSVLDNYCYLIQTGRHPNLEPLVRWWTETYRVLIKVPVVGSLQFDGLRDVDSTFQRAVDETIDRILAEWRIEAVRLDPARRDFWAADS